MQAVPCFYKPLDKYSLLFNIILQKIQVGRMQFLSLGDGLESCIQPSLQLGNGQLHLLYRPNIPADQPLQVQANQVPNQNLK